MLYDNGMIMIDDDGDMLYDNGMIMIDDDDGDMLYDNGIMMIMMIMICCMTMV